MDRSAAQHIANQLRTTAAWIEDGRVAVLDFQMHRSADRDGDRTIDIGGKAVPAFIPGPEHDLTIKFTINPAAEEPATPAQSPDNRKAILAGFAAAMERGGHDASAIRSAMTRMDAGQETAMGKQTFEIRDSNASREVVLVPMPSTTGEEIYRAVAFDGPPPNTPNRLRKFVERHGDPGVPYAMATVRRTMTKSTTPRAPQTAQETPATHGTQDEAGPDAEAQAQPEAAQGST